MSFENGSFPQSNPENRHDLKVQGWTQKTLQDVVADLIGEMGQSELHFQALNLSRAETHMVYLALNHYASRAPGLRNLSHFRDLVTAAQENLEEWDASVQRLEEQLDSAEWEVMGGDELSVGGVYTASMIEDRGRSFTTGLHTVLSLNETHVQTRYTEGEHYVREPIMERRLYTFTPAEQFVSAPVDNRPHDGLPTWTPEDQKRWEVGGAYLAALEQFFPTARHLEDPTNLFSAHMMALADNAVADTEDEPEDRPSILSEVQDARDEHEVMDGLTTEKNRTVNAHGELSRAAMYHLALADNALTIGTLASAQLWPATWGFKHLRPGDNRSHIITAMAYLLAEVERLDSLEDNA